MEIHEQAATGFERGAEVYERARPTYAAEAIEWLITRTSLGAGRTVADVAAGTGKFTRLLTDSGARVIAVEPVAAMRAALAAAVPGVEVVDGTAEHLPLADESVDVVTAAQAFHWFRGDEALAEFARVLVAEGHVALVWNWRDQNDPLMAAVTRIVDGRRGATPSHMTGAWRASVERTELFRPAGYHEVRHEQWVDAEGLVDRVASTSFIAAMPEHERAVLLAEVRALAPAGDARFPLPYVTQITLLRRIAS